jgi:hypothetical protein
VRTRSAARLAPLVVVLAAALAAGPAPARAASLTADHSCYTPDESILLEGEGFTPEGRVTLGSSLGRLATIATDPDGGFTVRVTVPDAVGRLALRFTATDRADRTRVAGTAIRIASVDVAIGLAARAPWRWRIAAHGFIEWGALYAHVRPLGSRRARTVRVGRLRGACGGLAVSRRLLPAGARPGAYVVQFDSNRRYVPRVSPSVTYVATILGVIGRSTRR